MNYRDCTIVRKYAQSIFDADFYISTIALCENRSQCMAMLATKQALNYQSSQSDKIPMRTCAPHFGVSVRRVCFYTLRIRYPTQFRSRAHMIEQKTHAHSFSSKFNHTNIRNSNWASVYLSALKCIESILQPNDVNKFLGFKQYTLSENPNPINFIHMSMSLNLSTS